MKNNFSTGVAGLPVAMKQLTPEQKRMELAGRITRYIIACKMVMDFSPSASYRTSKKLHALDMAINLKKLCNAGSTLRELCAFTIRTKNYLEEILPLQTNSGYETNLNNLNKILNDCRECTAAKTYVS